MSKVEFFGKLPIKYVVAADRSESRFMLEAEADGEWARILFDWEDAYKLIDAITILVRSRKAAMNENGTSGASSWASTPSSEERVMPKLFRVRYEGVMYMLAESQDDAMYSAAELVADEVREAGSEAFHRLNVEPVPPSHVPDLEWMNAIPRQDESCEIDDDDVDLTVRQWIARMQEPTP